MGVGDWISGLFPSSSPNTEGSWGKFPAVYKKMGEIMQKSGVPLVGGQPSTNVEDLRKKTSAKADPDYVDAMLDPTTPSNVLSAAINEHFSHERERRRNFGNIGQTLDFDEARRYNTDNSGRALARAAGYNDINTPNYAKEAFEVMLANRYPNPDLHPAIRGGALSAGAGAGGMIDSPLTNALNISAPLPHPGQQQVDMARLLWGGLNGSR